MSSKTTIVNQALLRCGHYNQIEQLDWGNPETPEEMLATRFYDDVRRECLTMGPWNFAEYTTAPTAIADWSDDATWPYAYAYPSDAVMIRRLRSYYSQDDLQYAIGLHKSGPSDSPTKIIKTKFEVSSLIYTVDLDLPDRYTPSFVSMFAWKLASNFGMALGLSEKQLGTIMQAFNNDLSAALALNATEGKDDWEDTPDAEAEWIQARGYNSSDDPDFPEKGYMG